MSGDTNETETQPERIVKIEHNYAPAPTHSEYSSAIAQALSGAIKANAEALAEGSKAIHAICELLSFSGSGPHVETPGIMAKQNGIADVRDSTFTVDHRQDYSKA